MELRVVRRSMSFRVYKSQLLESACVEEFPPGTPVSFPAHEPPRVPAENVGKVVRRAGRVEDRNLDAQAQMGFVAVRDDAPPRKLFWVDPADLEHRAPDEP
jgi:hypothetical protein